MGSDDWWRHNSPWPGHAPQPPGHAPGEERSSSYTPTPLTGPPPTGPWGGNTGGPGFTGGAEWSGGYAGGAATAGCGGVVALVAVVSFFATVPRALPLLGALYPLVAAIEIGVARGTFLVTGKLSPSMPNNTRVAIAAAACLVLLWPASRLEQRLANFQAYRVLRHIVRLALIGLFTYQLTSTMPLAEPMPPWMHPFRGLFRSPAQLAATVGAVLVMHFLLRNFLGIRSVWRRSLEFTRLRHA